MTQIKHNQKFKTAGFKVKNSDKLTIDAFRELLTFNNEKFYPQLSKGIIQVKDEIFTFSIS